jgi:hypothetical protein
MQALFNYLNTTTLDDIMSTMKKLQVGVKKKGNTYLFNYEDEAPRGHPIVDGCRGTIWQHSNLSGPPTWTCIRSAMDRFFNVLEVVDGIDTSVQPNTPFVVQEKLDGTLALLYWNESENTWSVGTRNSFDCTEIKLRGNVNMRQVFDMALGEHNLLEFNKVLNKLKNYSFLFELCSAFNQVVVYHLKPSVTLLSVRSNIYPYPELDPKLFQAYFPNAKLPQTFEFNNLDDCRTYVDNCDGASFEGMVLVQGSIEVPRRLKLKSKTFVTLAHTGNIKALPEEQILVSLLKGSNELAELLAYYPIWTDKANKITSLLQSFREKMAESQKDIDSLQLLNANRAQIANVAKTTVCPQYFFAVLSKKTDNLNDYLKGLDSSAVLTMIGYTNV